jgi:hypothetical protein
MDCTIECHPCALNGCEYVCGCDRYRRWGFKNTPKNISRLRLCPVTYRIRVIHAYMYAVRRTLIADSACQPVQVRTCSSCDPPSRYCACGAWSHQPTISSIVTWAKREHLRSNSPAARFQLLPAIQLSVARKQFVPRVHEDSTTSSSRQAGVQRPVSLCRCRATQPCRPLGCKLKAPLDHDWQQRGWRAIVAASITMLLVPP